uniref:Ankyrin repeat domain-containing protein 7 n=1 Tax=Aceria tosichella TaxID=561515 RepID=A0A6G1S7Y7_9ACAR
MKKYLPFSRRQPSLDRNTVSRGGWAGSDRFNGKSLRRTSAASLNTKSIQVVRGAYNIDLNKVDSSFTKLHRACLLNDDTQVKKHIQKVDNNCHDSSHRYPIHLATVNGNFAIIKLLIDNGANPDVQDNEGHTPLIKSIECGHEHLVKFFLNNGADPDVSDMDNNTALHWAIMTESIIAIEALLSSKKCNLTLRNNKDETCLHLAVRSPLISTATFEAMIAADSDLTAKDQLGLTVLDIALACNNKKALNAFERSKIDIHDKLPETVESNMDDPHHPISDIKQEEPNKTNCCDEYKQKYIIKNKENLEYERKIIQLTAQMERMKLDINHLREQNDSLQTDNKRLSSENSMLKLENRTMMEQMRAFKQKSENKFSKKDESEACDISLDKTSESIDCRGHKEFLTARNLNQERINKLKSSLTT